jgi:hypothetical protein
VIRDVSAIIDSNGVLLEGLWRTRVILYILKRSLAQETNLWIMARSFWPGIWMVRSQSGLVLNVVVISSGKKGSKRNRVANFLRNRGIISWSKRGKIVQSCCTGRDAHDTKIYRI